MFPSRDFKLGDDNDGWMSKSGIEKEVPRGVYTEYRNKRLEREQYRFEEDPSRYSEHIETFARGVDPFKDVQYNNTGIGQKQAYKPIVERIERVPMISPYDLFPLSRQPIQQGAAAHSSKKSIPNLNDNKDQLPKRAIQVISNEIPINPRSSYKILGDNSIQKLNHQLQFQTIPSQSFTASKSDQRRKVFHNLIQIDQKASSNPKVVPTVPSKKAFASLTQTKVQFQEDLLPKNNTESFLTKKSNTISDSQTSYVENPNKEITEKTSIPYQTTKHKDFKNKTVTPNLSRGIDQHSLIIPQISTQKRAINEQQMTRHASATIISKTPISQMTSKNPHVQNTDLSKVQVYDSKFVNNSNLNISSESKKNSYQKIYMSLLESTPNHLTPVLENSAETKKHSQHTVLDNNTAIIKIGPTVPKTAFQNYGFIPGEAEREMNFPSTMIRSK
jgi:hypothetical protein